MRGSAGETMDFVVKTAAESEDARKGVKQQIDIQGAWHNSQKRRRNSLCSLGSR